MAKTVGSYRCRHRNCPGVFGSENCARPGLSVVPFADGGASDGVRPAAAGKLPAPDEMLFVTVSSVRTKIVRISN